MEVHAGLLSGYIAKVGMQVQSGLSFHLNERHKEGNASSYLTTSASAPTSKPEPAPASCPTLVAAAD